MELRSLYFYFHIFCLLIHKVFFVAHGPSNINYFETDLFGFIDVTGTSENLIYKDISF